MMNRNDLLTRNFKLYIYKSINIKNTKSKENE